MIIQEVLQSLMESEMVTGGLLEELKYVHIGEMDLFPADKYPVAGIPGSGEIYFNGNHVDVERNITIILQVIEGTIPVPQKKNGTS